jgi:hypothetical protein
MKNNQKIQFLLLLPETVWKIPRNQGDKKALAA